MAGEPLVTIVGNLVADPEPRISQAGKPWVTFRIASTPRVRNKDSGDWGDGEAMWFSCRAYNDYANNIAASLKKGQRVIVQGRMSQHAYTDNQGQARTSLDLEVEEIGPSLRFATATVERAGQQPQQYAQQPQQGWPGGQPQGQPAQQSSWAQPQGQQGWAQPPQPQGPGNPWTQQNAPQQQQQQGGGFGSGFDDEQPF